MVLSWVKKHLYALGAGVLGATVILSSTIPAIVEMTSTNKLDISFNSRTDFTDNKYRNFFEIDSQVTDSSFQSLLISVPAEGWYNEAAFMVTSAIKECNWYSFFATEWSANIYGLHTDTNGPSHQLRLSFWSEITFSWPKNNKYSEQIYKLRLYFNPSTLHPVVGATGIYRSVRDQHREVKYLPFNHDWVEISDNGKSGGGVWVLDPYNESSLIFSNATFSA